MDSWELHLYSTAQVKEPQHDPRRHTNPLVLVGNPDYSAAFELPHFSLCNGTIVRVAHYLGFCVAVHPKVLGELTPVRHWHSIGPAVANHTA